MWAGPSGLEGRAAPPWAKMLAAYVLSRLVVFAGISVVATLKLRGARCGHFEPVPIVGIHGLSQCWDAKWFLQTALHGYPSAIPGADPGQSTIAFFPGYPILIAALVAIGVPPVGAAIGLSLVFGAIATLMLCKLALLYTTPEAAQRVGYLFCFFPGAFVLSWGYSEAMCTALAATCLLLLCRRRWLLAGLAGAAASAVRADVGLALVLAAGCTAVLAIRDRREFSALAAPVLAPLGAITFFGFIWWRTGSATTWTNVQVQGWGQYVDFGTHALNTVHRVLTNPLRSATSLTQLVAVVLFVVGLVVLVRRPLLPLPWLAYTGVLTVLMLVSSQVGFRPRAELILLPVFVAAGARLTDRALPWVIVPFAVVQVLLTVLYLGAAGVWPP
jgi:hypothetical protein